MLLSVNSDIKIDDDILRDVLGENTHEHLRVIVNSIQREQNKAIRYSDSKNLIKEIFTDLSEYSKTVEFLPFSTLATNW